VSWEVDKKWADTYFPEVKQIIRRVSHKIISIEVAPPAKDMKFATDYLIKVETGTIACRLRRYYYFERFGDLTFRSMRISGIETELSKLKKNYVRYYLYGWVKSNKITTWIFFDIKEANLRGLFDRDWNENINHDGQTAFISIPVKEFFCCAIDYELPFALTRPIIHSKQLTLFPVSQ